MKCRAILNIDFFMPGRWDNNQSEELIKFRKYLEDELDEIINKQISDPSSPFKFLYEIEEERNVVIRERRGRGTDLKEWTLVKHPARSKIIRKEKKKMYKERCKY
jgi:hypothetical protein